MADFGPAFGEFAEGLAGGFTAGSANRVAQQNALATVQERRRKAGTKLFELALEQADLNPVLAKSLLDESFTVGEIFRGVDEASTKLRRKTLSDIILKAPAEIRIRAAELIAAGGNVDAILRAAAQSGVPAAVIAEGFDLQSKALEFKKRGRVEGEAEAAVGTRRRIGRALSSGRNTAPLFGDEDLQNVNPAEALRRAFQAKKTQLLGSIKALQSAQIDAGDPGGISSRQTAIQNIEEQIGRLSTELDKSLSRLQPVVGQQFIGAEGDVNVLQARPGEQAQLRRLGLVSRPTRTDAQLALAQAITEVNADKPVSVSKNPLVKIIREIPDFKKLTKNEKLAKLQEARKLVSSVNEDAFLAMLRFFGVKGAGETSDESASGRAAAAVKRLTR